MLFRSVYLILFSALPVYSSLIPVNFFAIMPNMMPLEKRIGHAMLSKKFYLTKRGPDASILSRKYDIDYHFEMMKNYSPREILDIFCLKIFPKHTNTILYLKSNNGKIIQSSRDVIMDIAKSVGYPVISWDPEFPGALEVSTTYFTI